MALTPNSFSACLPALSTNIRQCGTVTQCNAKPLLESELTSTFTRSGEYKVMDALFMHDIEIGMCGAVQGTMYDFLMANKVNLSKKISSDSINSGLARIRPFILVRQHTPINKEFWKVTLGQASGESNWQVDITTDTGMPYDLRWFNVRDRVFIDGETAGGTGTKTAWQIVSSALVGSPATAIRLIMSPQNSATCLAAARVERPVTGLLFRGTPNVDDYESYCNESPGIINWKNVPFWMETTRDSFCKDKLYDKYRALLMAGNALYKEFGDLDTVELNRQQGMDFKQRWVRNFYFNKPLANQTLSAYDQLEQINSFSTNELGIGVRCVGLRANAVGVYEQLVCCGMVQDLQGAQLNLISLFNSLYQIWRTRRTVNGKCESIDIFTDRITADKINTGMLNYYVTKQGNAAMTMFKNVDQTVKTAEFGFCFRSYQLFYPQGLTINIITHDFFDDYVSAAANFGVAGVSRVLWVLDFTGIYPGILNSNRVVHKTGDLKALAAIDASFGCVMKNPTKEVTMTSMTWTAVVECPQSNLILENFSDAVPAVTDNGPIYPPLSTTTPPTTTVPTTVPTTTVPTTTVATTTAA